MDMTTTMFVSGNLVRDPRVNTTKDGVTVATLRIASTPRRFDRAAGEWVDGDPVFVSITCWRQLARNVFASLQKGDPVFAAGRVVQHTWERDGERRSELEIEASVVGPDVSRTVVQVMRRRREVPALDAQPLTGEVGETGEPASDVAALPAQPGPAEAAPAA